MAIQQTQSVTISPWKTLQERFEDYTLERVPPHAQLLLDVNALVVTSWITTIVADYRIARRRLKLAPARLGLLNIPAINVVGLPSILLAPVGGWFMPIADQKWLTAAIIGLVLYTGGSPLTKGLYLHRESEAEAELEMARIEEHYGHTAAARAFGQEARADAGQTLE